jgi:uncharacterized protein
MKPHPPGRCSRRRWLGFGIGGLALGAMADAFLLESRWLKVHRVGPATPSPTHRFVHLTDVHHKGDRAWLERVVRRINSLAPGFVCFTGDIVEDARFLPEALAILRGIRAPLYGVPGNHDYWAKVDFAVVAESFAATGGRWLMDEEVLTRDGHLNIIGATCTKAPDVRPREGLKNLLLIHYPFWVERLSGTKFDLILAGHSHGGQVRLPFLGAVLVPGGVGRYDLGLFRTPAGPVYVGSGIGWFYANVRFNCRPEIAVLEI